MQHLFCWLQSRFKQSACTIWRNEWKRLVWMSSRIRWCWTFMFQISNSRPFQWKGGNGRRLQKLGTGYSICADKSCPKYHNERSSKCSGKIKIFPILSVEFFLFNRIRKFVSIVIYFYNNISLTEANEWSRSSRRY